MKPKFRVWDAEMERWICEDSIYLQCDGEALHSAPWATFGTIKLPSAKFRIQQYTGIKDKNGREIYEGDIIKYIHSSDPDEDELPGRGEVYYNDNSAAFFFNLIQQHNFIDPSLIRSSLEVIGNIYEGQLKN